jgi:hypothetical protein
MKTLILHIGMFKTGTSSIQATLDSNSEYLKSKGIYYSSRLHHHNFTFFPLFYEEPETLPDWQIQFDREQAREKQRFYLDEWSAEFKEDFRFFIISSENVTLWERAEIDKALDFLQPHFDQIKVVIYLRSFTSYLSSAVQQLVKNAFSNKDLHTLLKEEIKFINYQELIQKWAEKLGDENIIVRNFRREFFKNNNLIDDFIDAVGISDIDPSQIVNIRVNESIGKHSVLLLNELNKKYPVFLNDVLNLERGLARRYIPLEVFEKVPDEKFELDIKYDAEEAQYLNNQLEYVNSFLPEGQELEYVEASDQRTVIPDASDIPISYYVEMINEYHRYIDQLLDMLEDKNKEG